MWTPLSEILPAEAERFGYKALRLAQAQARGLPVPDSLVLDRHTLAALREDPALAEQCARELCELWPTIDRVLLRSSSPLEDRRDSSAAGLLPTVSRAARPEAIARGLREMAARMEDADLRALLDSPDEAIPLAVLAQPQLELELWCTLEWNPSTGLARIEGRQLDACGDHPLELAAIPLGESDTLSESGVGLGALMELARRAQEGSEGVWLLELGVVAGDAVLLQRRPVAHAAPADESDTIGPAGTERFVEFPLFSTDQRGDWEWDAAHSPRPLAPLLASVFVEWIRERGEEHPSRIVDGRWHDRRVDGKGSSSNELSGDGSSAEALGVDVDADPDLAARELREALRHWYEERIPALERGLEVVELLAADSREYASWRLFVVAWLDWQGKYYDGAAGQLRRRIVACLGADRNAAELPETIARRRERELEYLAAHWESWDENLRGARLEAFLEEHGHHAPGGWDGYGIPWDEDPEPLLRELQRRAQVAATEDGAPEHAPAADTQLPPEDVSDERWAAHGLRALEDDDDLLAYAYALFRDAALNLEGELREEAEEGEILGILECDLASLERDGSAQAWLAARARGARMRAAWEAAMPSPLPPAAEGELLHGHPRLCAGQAEGRPRILDSALRDGGPEPGEILVVPTILPGDAIVFSRCAGLICESGEVLGHAAVLAREKSIPALVLPQACSRLRGVQLLHLDAEAGSVRILSREETT